MCDHATLDGVLRMIIKADQLPTCPDWSELKDEVAESELFTPEDLERSQEYIIQKFAQLRMERMTNKLLGKTNLPKPPSNGGSTSSEVLSTTSGALADDSRSENSSEDSATDEEGSLSPTLDEEANAERIRFMSVYLNRVWEGAVLKYCNEDESFVSLRIIDRHRLEVMGGQIRLTWKWDDSDESHMTEFFVRETLESDFILGKKCSDEDFNREIASPASKAARPINELLEQPLMQGLAQHPTQTWVNQTVPNVPNTKFISDVLSETIHNLEVNYRQDMHYPVPFAGLPHPGGILGEESNSSASSKPKHGSESGTRSRKSQPKAKTNRSNSKSTK